MFGSIRGSLLGWYSLILLAVLAGFGGVLYASVRRATLIEIDAELNGAAQTLAARFREGPGGMGRGMGMGMGPGPGFFRRGRGAVGPRGGPPGGPSPAEPPLSPDRDRPPPFREERIEIPEGLERRFGSHPGGGLYFVIWQGDGRESERSDGAPAAVFPGTVQPWRAEPGAAVYRNAPEDRREVIVTAGRGRQVLVGREIGRELAHLRRLAWTLGVTGAGVLAIGLVGGWVLAGRVVRPIVAIGMTAEAISATSLSQRIDASAAPSELGRLARVLNAMFARLEAAFERQTRFTADASHELRTPLAVIQAHAELALTRDRPPEEYRETLTTCLQAARRMKTLIDDLLTLARADAGNLELKRVPLDLAALTAQAAELLAPLAEEQAIQLESVAGLAGPVHALGDPVRIGQVIANLLTNAIQYNRPGGSVHIAVRLDSPWAVLEVVDTGIGIPEMDLPHVFDRFYRADRARSRSQGGSGLGLAIARGIVEAHGGTLALASRAGAGTTATVRLPATAPAPLDPDGLTALSAAGDSELSTNARSSE